MSGNLSSGHEPCNGGEGCSVSFWLGEGLGQWHEELQWGVAFGEVFRVDPFGASLGKVIQGQAAPRDDLTADPDWGGKYADELRKWGPQVVAALQNAASSVDFELTLLELEDKVVTDYTLARSGSAQGGVRVIQRSCRELETMNGLECPLARGFPRPLRPWGA
jgi:hypothetical protein